MSVEKKTLISSIAYYTIAILALAASIIFAMNLMTDLLPMWARIVYYVWIAIAIGLIIYDVMCTMRGEGKFISGIVVYILSILSVAMAVILYYINGGMNGLVAEVFGMFITIPLFALMISGALIALWVVGECKVEHKKEEININK